jgi:hypothetical protein
MGLSTSACCIFHHTVTLILGHILATMTLVHRVATMTFDTNAEFFIPVVAMLTSWHVVW